MEKPRPVVPLHYQRARPATTDDAGLHFPDRSRDLYTPAVLVLLGMLCGMAALVHVGVGLRVTAAAISSYLIVKGLILLVAVPVLVSVAGVSLGTLASAVLKLAAVSLLPEGLFIWILITTGACFGLLAGVVAGFLLACFLFTRLFEMDYGEAMLCVVLNWGIGIAFFSVWWWIFFGLMSVAL